MLCRLCWKAFAGNRLTCTPGSQRQQARPTRDLRRLNSSVAISGRRETPVRGCRPLATSSKSVETTSNAGTGASLVRRKHGVDLLLGADIDTGGGLFQDEERFVRDASSAPAPPFCWLPPLEVAGPRPRGARAGSRQTGWIRALRLGVSPGGVASAAPAAVAQHQPRVRETGFPAPTRWRARFSSIRSAGDHTPRPVRMACIRRCVACMRWPLQLRCCPACQRLGQAKQRAADRLVPGTAQADEAQYLSTMGMVSVTGPALALVYIVLQIGGPLAAWRLLALRAWALRRLASALPMSSDPRVRVSLVSGRFGAPPPACRRA